MQLEVVSASKCVVGEAPLWHPNEKRLYWVDTFSGILRRYDPMSGTTELCHEGEHIGGMTLQIDGALLLFTLSGDIKTWKDDAIQTIAESVVDEPFNDVIADPAGRVFAGVKAKEKQTGRICRIDTDASVHVVVEEILEPNGFGFSPGGDLIYMTDTKRRERYMFDYDPDTGDCTNQRLFVRNDEQLGIPDGMAVDAGGNVWSAQWNGSCVIKYKPDGVEEARVQFPVKKPASIAFGGTDYADAYVTTSIGDDWVDDSLGAGSLHRISAAGPGKPVFRSKVGL